MRRSWLAVLLVLVTSAALAACTGDDEPDPPGPTTTVTKKVNLTFGVWGTEPEIQAYQDVVDAYNAETDEATVKIKPYASHDELYAALQTAQVPDLYLANRGDLADLREQELNRPIGDLLDERNVDFGDGYSRTALEAFASDRDLQCMPYGISPMVIYYNKALVDFAAMDERELNTPNVDYEEPEKKIAWSFEQFQAAAEFSSRPRRGIAGFSVAPSLRGLAPFIFSGGGRLFNDDENPTSLAFASDDTKSALEEVLPLLRDPKVTLSAEQLAEKSPLEWFKEGKLGMIAGFRDLVPELRPDASLDFDIMPMPIVDDPATVGELTGICVAQNTGDVAESADFLVDFISTESVSAVAAAGYLAPANTGVALSDAFLQPGQLPLHAGVSNNSIRYMRTPPLIDNNAQLDAAVAGPLEALLEVEVIDLDALTQQIDDASVPVLAPADDEAEAPDDESAD